MGIQKEIDFTREVVKDNSDLKDFLTILRMDYSGYDLFSGTRDLNQIPFSDNWADGLSILQKKLQRDEVVKASPHEFDEAADWYLDNYLVKNPIIEKKELYYTNWWSVDSLPEIFYIIRYKNATQADAVAALNPDILLVL